MSFEKELVVPKTDEEYTNSYPFVTKVANLFILEGHLREFFLSNVYHVSSHLTDLDNITYYEGSAKCNEDGFLNYLSNYKIIFLDKQERTLLIIDEGIIVENNLAYLCKSSEKPLGEHSKLSKPIVKKASPREVPITFSSSDAKEKRAFIIKALKEWVRNDTYDINNSQLRTNIFGEIYESKNYVGLYYSLAETIEKLPSKFDDAFDLEAALILFGPCIFSKDLEKQTSPDPMVGGDALLTFMHIHIRHGLPFSTIKNMAYCLGRFVSSGNPCFYRFLYYLLDKYKSLEFFTKLFSYETYFDEEDLFVAKWRYGLIEEDKILFHKPTKDDWYSLTVPKKLELYGIKYYARFHKMEQVFAHYFGFDISLAPKHRKYFGEIYYEVVASSRANDKLQYLEVSKDLVDLFGWLRIYGVNDKNVGFMKKYYKDRAKTEIRFPDGSKQSLIAIWDEITPEVIPDDYGQRALGRNLANNRERQRAISLMTYKEDRQDPFPGLIELDIPGVCLCHLDTSMKLADEGETMGHCVGNYSRHLSTYETYYFSVRTSEHRATLKLHRHGSKWVVSECKGRANSTNELVTQINERIRITNQFNQKEISAITNELINLSTDLKKISNSSTALKKVSPVLNEVDKVVKLVHHSEADQLKDLYKALEVLRDLVDS